VVLAENIILSAIPSKLEGLDKVLNNLELEQFDHDETCHREITRLCVQDRLKHMSLHLAKYAGALFDENLEPTKIKRLVTDIFIISLSTLNILNVKASEALALKIDSASSVEGFAKRVARLQGKIATACEKMDHLEDFPFRPEIKSNTLLMLSEALHFIISKDWDLASLVRNRLLPIKQKSKFYKAK
jgi:hypothetical protein